MTQAQALTILKTGAHVFLTGEPGSGKTYVVNQYIRYLREAKIAVAVTAPTGIAATHIGGMTLHSWSGIGIKKHLTMQDVDRIATNQATAKRISRAKVLIIDEVSMLDGSMLEGVEAICREVRRNDQPFGGLQVVLVGDFFQLPPVTKDSEGVATFAFASSAWRELNPIVCYLEEQHRQEDSGFLEVLAALRQGEANKDVRERLDSRCGTQLPEEGEVTRLYAHNVNVDALNEQELMRLPGDSKAYVMTGHGKQSLVAQLIRGCLSPERLRLKIGAAVMFTKNNPKGLFVNGTLGRVVDFEDNGLPMVEMKSGRTLTVLPMEWTIEQDGRAQASIAQVPLRLAWALTIHKSQGMSLDAAEVDLRNAFVPGQGYVALSRVRRLSGLYLTGYNEVALQVNEAVKVQDNEFRVASAEADKIFGAIGAKELRQMQENFVRATGGSLSRERKKKHWRPREAADTGKDIDTSYSVDEIRKDHVNAYKPWKEGEEILLLQYHEAGKKPKEIAELLGRKPGAIYSRLKKIAEQKS